MMVLALIIGMIVSPTLAASDVMIRSAERADGGRLLIEWSDPIRVLQKKDEDRLTLRFSRALAADIGPALDRLAAYLDVDRTVIKGTDLTLALKPGVASTLQIKRQKVVIIDLTSQHQDEDDVKLTVTPLQNGMRLVFEWPHPTGFKTWDQDGRLMVTFTSNGRIRPSDLDYLNETFQPWFSHVQRLQKPSDVSLVFQLKPMIISSVKNAGERHVEIDLTRDASAVAKDVNVASRTETKQEEPEQPSKIANEHWPPKPEMRPVTISDAAISSEQPSADKLVFDWEEGVGAAIFKRAGYLWAVFDAPIDLSKSTLPPPLPDSLMPGEIIQSEDATTIRFRMKSDINVSVYLDDAGRWTIEPDDDPSLPASIPLLPADSPGVLRAAGASSGQIVEVTDPLVGDQLSIWPLGQAGMGQPKRRRFVDLEIQESIQGLVWRPLNDDLMVVADLDGIEFKSGQGLALSSWSNGAADGGPVAEETTVERNWAQPGPIPEENANSQPEPAVVERSSPEPAPSSYLDFAGSGLDRNLVVETRRVLRQAIRKSKPEKRDQARLDLARVLIAENLASEAKIVLQTMSEELEDPLALSNRVLRGAAAFLAGDVDQASALLRASEFDKDSEIGLWRSALSSRDQDWQTAAEGWKEYSDSLDMYPPKLRLELGLLALETAIEINDDNDIRKGFRRLKKLELEPYEMAQIDRMHALKAMRDGDFKRAEELLRSIADGRYPVISKLADFELASLMQDKEPNDASLLATFRDRLPLWRGHPQEIRMIDRLATGYRDVGEPRQALQLWRHLSNIHPETEDDAIIKNERRATYVDALASLAEERIGLFDAYAIYLDFVDLLPVEPEDRPVHQHLAGHLAGLDLLDESVSVLQPLLEGTPGQAEAARIGLKIAELLLVQDRSDEALVVLDRTKAPSGADLGELRSERKILRARTLARLGRNEEALEQIRDLQTRPARHVRAKIFWQQRNWNRLANVIETILDDPNLPPPLDDEDQKLVLWLSLARNQLGQVEEVGELRRRYAGDMASGPWSEAFIVGTQTDAQIGDINSLLKHTENQLAELRRFRDNANADR